MENLGKDKTIGKMGRSILATGYLYLLIPICIFLVGYLKWYIALPLLLAISASFYFALQNAPALTVPEMSSTALVKCVAAIFIIAIITMLSGVGGKVYQSPDHHFRNEIFKILVDYPWPVIKGDITLVYYTGFWMPAALVGKLFGLEAGFFFQILWMAIGLYLLFLLLCIWQKKILLWPLIIFLFFSGLDILGVLYNKFLLTSIFNLDVQSQFNQSSDYWNVCMMYPSLLTNLFWSFQQAVPVYLLVLLFLLEKNCRSFVFLAAPCLLSCTLAVIGMVPIALSFVFSVPVADDPIERRWLKGKGKLRHGLKDVFTIQNLLGGGSMALILWLYLSANWAGQKIELLSPWNVDILYVMYWLVALIVEYGIYTLVLLSEHKKNPLLIVSFCCLAIAPWIRVGYSVDFVMRVSMANLPFLALLSIDMLERTWQGRKYVLFGTLVLLLGLGALTSVSEIRRTILQTPWGEKYQMTFVPEDMILGANNFTGDAHGNLFFDVLCR